MTPNITECLTLQYVAGFQCLGGACEDNCCHHWRVALDRATFRKLKKTLEGAKAGRELFKKTIKRNRQADEQAINYAHIVLQKDGACPFLEPGSGLCNIQARYGVACLSPICVTYPRQYSQQGDRVEIGMHLSCPEAARRCLLSEAGTELIAVDPPTVMQEKIFYRHRRPLAAREPLAPYHEVIREVMLQILAARDYPLASRLFFTAYFANRTAPLLQQGAAALEQGLAAEIELLAKPANLAELQKQFQSLAPAVDLPVSIILNILLERTSGGTSLDKLLFAILRNYGMLNDQGELTLKLQAGQGGSTFDFSEVVAAYLGRREQLQEAVAGRLDLIFENYTRNYWFMEMIDQSANLLAHTQNLFVRLAVLRFLLFSHPGLNDLAARPAPFADADRQARVDQVAIEVFYRFSRGIEHSSTLLPLVVKALAEQNMQSLAHLVLLLKV